MYLKLKDFVADWKYESEATQKFFTNITDEILAVKENENIRSIGRLCWHITITISEMMNKTGLLINGPEERSNPPQHMSEISEAYKKSSDELVVQIQSHWNDDSLQEENNLYGESWKNGKTLQILVQHQIHHRGQMTVLMRLHGIKVPGIYGPSKEEGAEWGLVAEE